MLTRTEVEAHLETMKPPIDNQALVDQLSTLVVTGAIDTYAAKDCLECGDWERARRLIEEVCHE